MNTDLADPLPRPPLAACLLTPPGRGGVATIGVRGELGRLAAHLIAVNGRAPQEQDVDRLCFGRWGGDPGEEIVFVRTGRDEAEIHCHGGRAATRRILGDLQRCGADVLEPDRWLRSTEPLLVAECRIALTRGTTLRTAQHLLRQVELLPPAVTRIRRSLPADRLCPIDGLLQWSEFGRHLTVPWQVALCGRPNVGKSSLINALAGFTRALVYDAPGTTRDVVTVETALDGWPVEFSDTAGLRDAAGELEAAGMALARERLRQADLVLIVLDASVGLLADDETLLGEFPAAELVWNKSDLGRASAETGIAAKLELDCTPPGGSPGERRTARLVNGLAVSALQGTELPELMRRIVSRLIPHEPPEGAAFPVSAEQCERLRRLRSLCVSGDVTGFEETCAAWLDGPALR